MSTGSRDTQSAKTAPSQQRLGPTSEPAETFAEQVNPAVAAQRVMGAPPGAIRPADVLALQRTIGNRAVQSLLARRADHLGPRDANGVTEGAEAAVDRASSSIGEPLPDSVRGRFESSLGARLSEVRIHTGGESAEAADAVGAKAYTVGQDIHFGAGHYAPANPDGLHLLAHEVAHTVQQSRAVPTRQREMEVSTPDDEAEIEADRAADAIVAAASVGIDRESRAVSSIRRPGNLEPLLTQGTALVPEVLSGSGAYVVHTVPRRVGTVAAFRGRTGVIERDKDTDGGNEKDSAAGQDQDKAWATDIRAKVQGVQDAAQTAGETLNSDADLALKAIKGAQQSYISFEAAYNEAVGRFTKGVEKAMKDAEELRSNVKVVANVALATFGGEAGELVAKTGEVLEKVETAGKFVGELQAVPAGPGDQAKGGEAKDKDGEGKKPDTKPGPTDLTDWRALLQETIDSYDKYIKGNESISAMTKACLENVKWLDTVVDGKASDNARTSAEGQKAQNFGDGSAKAIAQLASIQAGAVSSGAAEFAKNVSNALDHQTVEKMEQDIAIKWISSLSREEVSAIGDAGSYLKKIGVIDSKGNRLGVDTGIWTFEWDTVVIRARAQTEQRAKEMVGSTRQWGGGKRVGDTVVGEVRGDEKSSNWWRAIGPPTLKEEEVGEVRVVSFAIAPIDKDVSSNWEHVNESALGNSMIAKVTLSVEPFGESKKDAGDEVK